MEIFYIFLNKNMIMSGRKNCNHVNRKLNKWVQPPNLKRRVSLGWIPLEELKNYEKN